MAKSVKGFTLGITLAGLTLAMSAGVNALNVININEKEPKNITINSSKHQNGFASSQASETLVNYKNKNFKVKTLREQTDKSGITHTRYVQTYNDIPVWGRQVIKHKNNKQRRVGFAGTNDHGKLTGELVDGLNADLAGLSLIPGFTKDEALKFAKEYYINSVKDKELVASNLVYENEKSDLIIYTHDKDGKAKLAYNVSFFVDDQNGDSPARPTYLIDATDKKVLKTWNALMHKREATGPGGNEKIGKYVYGGDMPKLDIRVAARNECFMVSDKVRTVNLRNGYYGAKTHHFTCYDSDNDAVNGAYSALNDAHYYGEQLFNMYSEWYDKAPLTFKLTMRVHYGRGYENAFWNGSSMTFGDGKDYFYPLVSMDVVGHEVSHGYTEQNSNLEYMGQSGGINESFSDMAGKASEYYVFGKNSWGIGDDITKGNEPLRYMDTPEKDGTSIGDARDYSDWLDVHYTSGVFNKAFYLLATHDNWTIKKAFDVFVHANTYYWVASTGYADGAMGAVFSAEDLGYDSKDVISVFNQVGIGCDMKTCKILPDDRTKPDDTDPAPDTSSEPDTEPQEPSDDDNAV